MRIRQLIEDICDADGDPKTFTQDHSGLLPALKKLGGSVPEDLQEYLDFCIPTSSYGRMVEFHSVSRMLEENTEYVPGADSVAQGFWCFAKAGDGSQYAYSMDDRKIYLIGPGSEKTKELTKAHAESVWDSLQALLEWYLQELTKVLDEEKATGTPSDDGEMERTDGREAFWLLPEEIRWLAYHCCCPDDAPLDQKLLYASIRHRAIACIMASGEMRGHSEFLALREIVTDLYRRGLIKE